MQPAVAHSDCSITAAYLTSAVTENSLTELSGRIGHPGTGSHVVYTYLPNLRTVK